MILRCLLTRKNCPILFANICFCSGDGSLFEKRSECWCGIRESGESTTKGWRLTSRRCDFEGVWIAKGFEGTLKKSIKQGLTILLVSPCLFNGAPAKIRIHGQRLRKVDSSSNRLGKLSSYCVRLVQDVPEIQHVLCSLLCLGYWPLGIIRPKIPVPNVSCSAL